MALGKSYWIKNGKYTLFQRLAMLVFGGLGFYLLVRTIDKEGYGIWMLFISVSTLLNTAREGFLKKPLIMFLNKLKGEDLIKLKSSALGLNMLFSLITGTLLVVFSGVLSGVWEAPDLIFLFYIFFVTNLLAGAFSHLNNVQEAYFRFKGPLVGHFIKSGVLFAFIAYFYFSDSQVTVALLGLCDLAATVVATGASYLMCRKLLHFRFRPDKKWTRELFSYGKYTLGTNIGGMFLRHTDIWMLGLFISPAAVAVYNVAIRVANLFEVPTMAMAAVIFPQAVKKAESEGDNALKELYEKSVTAILILVVPIALLVIVFSNEIIWFLAGEGYSEAGFILKLTMLYGLIIPFSKQMGVLLDAIGQARINMLFVVRNALINIVLNAIFIPPLGVAGAAYGTLSTMIIVFFLNTAFLKRKYHVDLRNIIYYSKSYFFRIRKSVMSH